MFILQSRFHQIYFPTNQRPLTCKDICLNHVASEAIEKRVLNTDQFLNINRPQNNNQ